MKRITVAVLAALALLTAADPASARGTYYYIPIIIPGPGGAVMPDPRVGSYAGIHKVAILMALGTQLRLHSPILDKRLDIASWNTDQEIAGTIRRYLGGRFEFADMTLDAAQVGAVNALPIEFLRETKTGDLVKTFNNPGVDAYILVRPLTSDGALELFFRGYNRIALQTNYEIDVIDAHSGRYISKSVGRIAELPGDPPQFPGAAMPDGFWSGFDSTLPPGKMELLHKYLTQMMTRSLVETIRSLQFGVDLPPTGDHSIAEPVMAGALSGIRSVAVVSAIGNQLQMINPGNMFIDKTDVSVATADWGLDERIEGIMRDTLSRNYTVKPVHANREVLSREMLTGGMRLQMIPGFDATKDVDAFVVLLPAVENGRPYHGLGMLHWTPLMNREADVYADYAIVVIDARNLVPVTGYVAVRGEAGCDKPERVLLPFPECRVDEKLFPAKDAGLGADAAAQLRKTLDTLLASSIPETLFHLGLDGGQAASQ